MKFNRHFLQLVCVASFFSRWVCSTQNRPQCHYLDQSSFENCASHKKTLTSRKYIRKYNMNNKYWRPEVYDTAGNCTSATSCQKLYQTIRIRSTFSNSISFQVAQILDRCCKGCSRYNETSLSANEAEDVGKLSDEFDIVYPVYTSRAVVGSQGFHFIPVYVFPKSYYITLKKSEKEMAKEIIMSCVEMWPLLIICVLMSLIAGFFIWICETWASKDDFPRPFVSGVSQGFWWAFVTMTTVGYGDKSPRSLPGRIFSILWMVIGMTVCSIYIASIATKIMDMANPPTPDAKGNRVGALKGRPHDLITTAQQGGVLHQVEFNDTILGIIELLEKLKAKEINGILLSQTSYHYFKKQVHKKASYSALMPDIQIKLTQKSLEGNDLVAGMLVKRWEDYHFFKMYFEINWARIQGCYSFEHNHKKLEWNDSDENILEGLFLPFFHGTVAILVAIIVFGVIYEVLRRRNFFQREAKNVYGEESAKLS